MKKTVNPAEELEKDQAIQVAAENKATSLNAAASLLMSMLSEPVREMLLETAATTLNIPLWQLAVGILQQSYDIGLFTTPQLDPDWSSNLPSKPAILGKTACKQCLQIFEPRWPKQEFCSNECGTNYQLSLARDKRPGHVVGGEFPLGQERRHAPSSALRPADAD